MTLEAGMNGGFAWKARGAFRVSKKAKPLFVQLAWVICSSIFFIKEAIVEPYHLRWYKIEALFICVSQDNQIIKNTQWL